MVLVFMRSGHSEGKGQGAVKVLDESPETSFSSERCCHPASELICVQLGEKSELFIK